MNELNVNRDDEVVDFETVAIAIGEEKRELFVFKKRDLKLRNWKVRRIFHVEDGNFLI